VQEADLGLAPVLQVGLDRAREVHPGRDPGVGQNLHHDHALARQQDLTKAGLDLRAVETTHSNPVGKANEDSRLWTQHLHRSYENVQMFSMWNKSSFHAFCQCLYFLLIVF
jgi:hypothetical protein